MLLVGISLGQGQETEIVLHTRTHGVRVGDSGHKEEGVTVDEHIGRLGVLRTTGVEEILACHGIENEIIRIHKAFGGEVSIRKRGLGIDLDIACIRAAAKRAVSGRRHADNGINVILIRNAVSVILVNVLSATF